MTDSLFKYKALTLNNRGLIDERTKNQVIEPIAESYYYLPTRQTLNDPNEGMFNSLVESEIPSFLRGVAAIGERTELTKSLLQFDAQLTQSNDNSGVFSLSHTPTDELMWAHYCAAHLGIAIEYKLEQLIRFSSSEHLHCFKVNYSPNPPDLSLKQIQANPKEAIRTMLGHKSPQWSYEEKFRVLLENINGGVPHDYRAIKSITFGLNVPMVVREEIFQETKAKVPCYFEILSVKNSYQLERAKIKAYTGNSPAGNKCNIDTESFFQDANNCSRETLCDWAKKEIESDPHFSEFWQAEVSSIEHGKAVLQYEASHNMGLDPWVSDTKVYRDLPLDT